MIMSARSAVPCGFNRPEFGEYVDDDNEDQDALLHKHTQGNGTSPQANTLLAEMTEFRDKAQSISQRCTSCGIRRRDLLMVPCGHTDICLACFNSSLHKAQKCPTCEADSHLVMVFEPILGSRNYKVLAEFSRLSLSN